MKKHIQRFLRAARADTTAFSVYPRLIKNKRVKGKQDRGDTPGFCIPLYRISLRFYRVYCLVLLFNEYTHLDHYQRTVVG